MIVSIATAVTIVTTVTKDLLAVCTMSQLLPCRCLVDAAVANYC